MFRTLGPAFSRPLAMTQHRASARSPSPDHDCAFDRQLCLSSLRIASTAAWSRPSHCRDRAACAADSGRRSVHPHDFR